MLVKINKSCFLSSRPIHRLRSQHFSERSSLLDHWCVSMDSDEIGRLEGVKYSPRIRLSSSASFLRVPWGLFEIENSTSWPCFWGSQSHSRLGLEYKDAFHYSRIGSKDRSCHLCRSSRIGSASFEKLMHPQCDELTARPRSDIENLSHSPKEKS